MPEYLNKKGNMSLRLKIVSPEKVVFNGEVQSVTVPGTSGVFEILTDHAPIISSLQQGIVTYQTGDGSEKTTLPIGGGFVAVQKNEVSLCVETS